MYKIHVFYLIVFLAKTDCRLQFIVERIFEILHEEPPPPLLSKERGKISTKWITQKVDNFNKLDPRIWKMRYMENGNYFKPGGPIFIYVGGEWTISPGYLRGGHMYDMGKQYNGYMFYTEHRYYGKSSPFRYLSVESLQYLNVQQSLADLAHFIKFIKSKYPGMNESKVILVGGSYAGSMVVWFQRLYPGLAAGSWASSAPLLAKVDFKEYKEIVGQSIALVGGQSCYDRIADGFKEINKMFEENPEKLLKLLNICANFDIANELDVWTLFSSFSYIFADVVQRHNKYAYNIQNACWKINSKKTSFDGVLNYLFKNIKKGWRCNDFSYSSYIRYLKSIRQRSSSRQWTYQTCSEYGWFQTSGSKNQPFGNRFPVELYINICKDVFGEKFSNKTIYGNIMNTNRIFGGMNPNVKNVIMTHGQLDPWRPMGIQESNGESNVIPLYSHCRDLDSISFLDSKEMKMSKKRVQQKIEEWLT